MPIRLYSAKVSSNMTNDLYMSKAKFKNSQLGYDDSYNSSKRLLASVEEERKNTLRASFGQRGAFSNEMIVGEQAGSLLIAQYECS